MLMCVMVRQIEATQGEYSVIMRQLCDLEVRYSDTVWQPCRNATHKVVNTQKDLEPFVKAMYRTLELFRQQDPSNMGHVQGNTI